MPQIRPFGTSPITAEWQGFVDSTPALVTRAAWQCVLTRVVVGVFDLEIPIWMDDGEIMVQVNLFGLNSNRIATKIAYFTDSSPQEGQARISFFYSLAQTVVGTVPITSAVLTALNGAGFSLNGIPVSFLTPGSAAEVASQINATLGIGAIAHATVGPGNVIVVTPLVPSEAFTFTVGIPDALAILGITPGSYGAGALVDPPGLFNLEVIQCSDYVSSIEGPYYP